MTHFKFIDVIDLPSDKNGSLGSLRTALTRAYNFNRDYPEKLLLLQETMQVISNAIDAGLLSDDIFIVPKPTSEATAKVTTKPTRAAKRTKTKDK